MDANIRYSVVVPVYNEEQVIGEAYARLTRVMESLGESYEIIFVDDGSRDRTPELAERICESDGKAKLISFSRNFGHQAAITAGMNYSSGDAVIVIDADLQDPPEVIPGMIEKWKQGCMVVYGRRLKREGDSAFKKATAKMFYRLLNRLSDVEIPADAGDFRLIDRKVCDVLNMLPERNRYVRGLVSWIGFSQAEVGFVRNERFAGETKYPLKKMLKFAADAIVSFSSKPLKIAMYLGLITSIATFLYLAGSLWRKLIAGMAVPAWKPLGAAGIFFNGIILFAMGISGEYLARIYDEAKGRPLYIISRKKNFDGPGPARGSGQPGK